MPQLALLAGSGAVYRVDAVRLLNVKTTTGRQFIRFKDNADYLRSSALFCGSLAQGNAITIQSVAEPRVREYDEYSLVTGIRSAQLLRMNYSLRNSRWPRR